MKPTEGKAEMKGEARQRPIDTDELLDIAIPEPVITLDFPYVSKQILL